MTYLLPKIHKAGNPGRPIVSANGHPTEKIVVDLHLQSHVNTLPSYLQDTTDFLKKQEVLGPIPSHALLVSMNVTSLYTNIPHSDGIKACEKAWKERDIKDPPSQTLATLLTLVLKCNNFEFNGQHYLQVQGTAMGTKVAPAYANMFMGRLEKQLLISVTMRPFSWLRFIDDIDMKWLHGRDNLDTFLQEANSFHSTIRFKMRYRMTSTFSLTPNPDWMRIEHAQILRIPTSIFNPQVATLNTAARISHIVLHCASDAFALTQTCLNKEPKN